MATNLNGWNVEAMNEAVDAVRKNPAAGRLRWRGRASWDGGFGLDVHTEAIEQLGQALPRHFTLRGDHPPELLGANTGPTAIETCLAALGSCITGTYAAQATARGVKIDALEVDVEGSIDLNGFFGLREVPPRISGVQVRVRVASDADPAVLREILDATRAHSPIYDTLTQPVAVAASVHKA